MISRVLCGFRSTDRYRLDFSACARHRRLTVHRMAAWFRAMRRRARLPREPTARDAAARPGCARRFRVTRFYATRTRGPATRDAGTTQIHATQAGAARPRREGGQFCLIVDFDGGVVDHRHRHYRALVNMQGQSPQTGALTRRVL